MLRLFAILSLFSLLPFLGDSVLLAQEPIVHSREEDSLAWVAITNMDAGNYELARQQLHAAAKRFPANSTYPYELAYILYREERYSECLKSLLKVVDAPDAIDRYHELLGLTYDNLGDTAAARAAYLRGLERFPGSGPLNMQCAIIAINSDNDLPRAMSYFERGIAGDPAFTINYYHAARIWMRSPNPGWGLLYGEIYLSLEPEGKRVEEMRELLFATWSRAITTQSSAAASLENKGLGGTLRGGVNLFKGVSIEIDSLDQVRYPFQHFYEKAVAAAPYIAGQTGSMTIANLHSIRSRFVDGWFTDTAVSRHFAIDLFDRQRALKAAGLLEAYDHLVFGGSSMREETSAWQEKNSVKMTDVLNWLEANPISTDTAVSFSRMRLTSMPRPK